MADRFNDVKIIQLPKIVDDRGNLSFIEEENYVTFKLNYYGFPIHRFFNKGKRMSSFKFFIILISKHWACFDDAKGIIISWGVVGN